VLLAAGAWRAALAVRMPCLSRDGSLFCWFARDLGEHGLRVLRGGGRIEHYDQHPLFSAALLLAQRVLRASGAPDAPWTWQYAGQIVAWLSGMGVIVLTAALAARLARVLRHEHDDRAELYSINTIKEEICTTVSKNPAHKARLDFKPAPLSAWALALAALLPLNNELSADVMSDQLHLLFYLAGVYLLVGLREWRAALGCGLCSGLAFLTRPEGAVVCLSAGLLLGLRLLRERCFQPLALGLAVAAGFLICAAPYWLVLGGLSPKTGKEPVERFVPAAARPIEGLGGHLAHQLDGSYGLFPRRPHSGENPERGTQPVLAALVRREVEWWLAAPVAAYETVRAGRVVVPLLAIPALWSLRRRVFEEPLVGPLMCMAIHFALTAVLVSRYGYLSPRHTLVVVALLIPPAAGTIVEVIERARRAGRVRLAVAAVIALPLPLAYYAQRVPNGIDGYIADAARQLREHDANAGERVLMGGASQRRIAFYADMRFAPWPEDEPDDRQRFEQLRQHLLDGRPDYFAIEVGGGREIQRNRELLERIMGDGELGPRLKELFSISAPRDRRLRVFSLRP
jgi:hypothetical protein